MNYKNIFLTFVLSFLTWLLLNGSLDRDILISGFVVATFISFVFCRRCDVLQYVNLSPKGFLYAIAYVFVFGWALIKANLDVAFRVIKPSLPINPGIVKVKTKLKTPIGKMMLANSITLTPGTITVDIKDDTLYIHWIDVTSTDIEEATKNIVSSFEKYLEVMYG